MISICFVHFRTVDLVHLDAALYSLSRQDFTGVQEICFLDNNTEHLPESIQALIDRYAFPVPVVVRHEKHGDPTRTQSWSVNNVCQSAKGPWLFFTRSDYVLDWNALARMRDEVLKRPTWDQRLFVTGWCLQMGYDAALSNAPANVDLDQYNWRVVGMPALLEHPYLVRFTSTAEDAGVWFTNKAWMAEAGWMNEKLVAWGFQQSTFQRALRRIGISCVAVPDFLFAHQHHYAPRDFAVARSEYNQHGGGV